MKLYAYRFHESSGRAFVKMSSYGHGCWDAIHPHRTSRVRGKCITIAPSCPSYSADEATAIQLEAVHASSPCESVKGNKIKTIPANPSF